MCLAVPGKVVAIAKDEADPIAGHVATVDFQGSRVEVSLAMTPQVGLGDWVLVHAGFAITVLDEAGARQTWEYLDSSGLGEIPSELRAGAPAAPAGESDEPELDGG
jgi:hydrogenase expression/formation protein HypC